MQLLLAHWHCILPAAAIIIGLVLMNRGGGKGSPKDGGTGARKRRSEDHKEMDKERQKHADT